jgi:phosphoribosyl 1,2-cyclic phosphate phosphodiesterase
MNKITILGSGTSTGIPMVGCQCKVCQSTDVKDQRLRTSAFIEALNGQSILIDTTPDLRAQLLNHQITRVDAAIITHDHADHLNGIDDLRPLCFHSCSDSPDEIPLFTYAECAERIEQRFGYAFARDKKVLGGGVPKLSLEQVEYDSKTQIAGQKFEFFLNPHGGMKTLAFVHQSMAYVIDCQSISRSNIEWLKNKNLELLIIDCVRDTPHQTHLHLERALDYIQQIRPKKAGLIHMGHQLSHQKLTELGHKQENVDVFPCFDGQVLTYPAISG